MTKLNEAQQGLIHKMRQMVVSLTPTIDRLKAEYDKVDYLTKQPLRDALEEAQAAGIPMNAIVKEGMGFPYPKKLTQWLYPDDETIERINALDDEELHFEVDLSSVQSVTRKYSGEFEVLYDNKTYTIKAIGPDDMAWSDREPDVPQAVYDLIAEQYAGYEVLDEEDY